MKDTQNPPGQVRYLRDVIKKYYEEETVQETVNDPPYGQVPTDAEKRIQARLWALADLRHLYQHMSLREYREQLHDLGLLRRAITILEDNPWQVQDSMLYY